MEVSIENKSKDDIGLKVSQKEDSTLKNSIENNSSLIKNELNNFESSDQFDNIDSLKNKEIKLQKFKLYQFVGRTLFLFLDKYGNPLFIIGPDWPMFICLITTNVLMMLFIYFKYWSLFGFKMKLIGRILYTTFIVSYSYSSLINPGYPRNTIGRSFGIPRNDYYFCEYCGFYLKKCSYGSHCEICQICVEKHDHHCVWTGHCIGKNNKIMFIVFIISLFSVIIYYGYAIFEGIMME